MFSFIAITHDSMSTTLSFSEDSFCLWFLIAATWYLPILFWDYWVPPKEVCEIVLFGNFETWCRLCLIGVEGAFEPGRLERLEQIPSILCWSKRFLLEELFNTVWPTRMLPAVSLVKVEAILLWWLIFLKFKNLIIQTLLFTSSFPFCLSFPSFSSFYLHHHLNYFLNHY